MDAIPGVREIERRYERELRADEAPGGPSSLADDALTVVLEWGPAKRLSETWRLERRQPSASAAERASALAASHEVTRAAYDLTSEAWPRDGREDPADVDRVAAEALETLSLRYPQLMRASLRRAIGLANYTHAK